MGSSANRPNAVNVNLCPSQVLDIFHRALTRSHAGAEVEPGFQQTDKKP